MIGWIRGVLIRRSLPSCLVDVGGVGYELEISARTLESLPATGSEVEFDVLTVVRPESLSLYGFLSSDEKLVFTALLGVSGIGPRLSLAILSDLRPARLVAVVQSGDAVPLTAVSGVGKKTADRILLELRGKLPEIEAELPAAVAQSGASDALGAESGDAVAALEQLGYRRGEAEAAVRATLDDGGERPLPELIRGALRRLGRR